MLDGTPDVEPVELAVVPVVLAPDGVDAEELVAEGLVAEELEADGVGLGAGVGAGEDGAVDACPP